MGIKTPNGNYPDLELGIAQPSKSEARVDAFALELPFWVVPCAHLYGFGFFASVY